VISVYLISTTDNYQRGFVLAQCSANQGMHRLALDPSLNRFAQHARAALQLVETTSEVITSVHPTPYGWSFRVEPKPEPEFAQRPW
jgi:hypothetical protein